MLGQEGTELAAGDDGEPEDAIEENVEELQDPEVNGTTPAKSQDDAASGEEKATVGGTDEVEDERTTAVGGEEDVTVDEKHDEGVIEEQPEEANGDTVPEAETEPAGDSQDGFLDEDVGNEDN